ncbi:MAG: UDP-2,3-diacylglucosamine diphosphatase, partial [Phycisphaerae bacterium]|nr:UDP-2,3-diacylglucosamine diphosphatase [Phycisphaerae bacterium]
IKRDVKGTQITFIPGNHDEVFRDYDGMTFGGVSVHKQAIHTCADGKRLLVLHGDEFDAVVTNAKLITAVGDWLYYVLLWINRGLNQVRRLFRRPYWSLAGYIKNKVKSALQFVNNYEGYVARAAREAGVQGVICGHIHRPEVRMIGDILYCNCGDWVENCTAIVEHDDGRIELLDLKHPGRHRKPTREKAAPQP